MPEDQGQMSNITGRKHILDSSITRVIAFSIVLVLYYVFLSPTVEEFLNQEIGNVLGTYSNEEVNRLTPVFDIHVYAGDYELGSTASKLNITSRTKLFTKDPRIAAMNKFLLDYHSPMATYAEVFITEAEKYGLDWRIVASISGVESAFGNLIPTDTNNGWGWRGGPGGDWSHFTTWADGIKEVTRGLGEGYGIHMTPFDIEPIYCPPCGRNPAHAWANGVTRFMNELSYYVDNLENI